MIILWLKKKKKKKKKKSRAPSIVGSAISENNFSFTGGRK